MVLVTNVALAQFFIAFRELSHLLVYCAVSHAQVRWVNVFLLIDQFLQVTRPLRFEVAGGSSTVQGDEGLRIVFMWHS